MGFAYGSTPYAGCGGRLKVRGDFVRDAAVACCSATGEEIARGLVNYNVAGYHRIARKPSAEIEKLLGYVDEPERIHRDNMVWR